MTNFPEQETKKSWSTPELFNLDVKKTEKGTFYVIETTSSSAGPS